MLAACLTCPALKGSFPLTQSLNLHACAGQWDGAGKPTGGALPLPPDLGPAAADASTGVCTVGAATLVVNFNLPLTVRPSPACKLG